MTLIVGPPLILKKLKFHNKVANLKKSKKLSVNPRIIAFLIIVEQRKATVRIRNNKTI